MAEKALASSRFWQTWTLLGVLGTALAGTRLLSSTSSRLVQAPNRASERSQRATPRPALESAPTPAPSVDRLFARLRVAATAAERCALLERVLPSEDPQPTYAITALLERSQFGSVRTCATEALGRQPTSEAQSFLVDLAEDPEPGVHRSAFDALAIRDEAACAVVVEATHSEDLERRVSAVEALLKAKRAEAYSAAVLVLPLIEDPETLASLIDAIGQSHDPRALPALLALLSNADRESHLRAIAALGELGVPSAAVHLEGLLELGSSEEFSAAAEALKMLTPESISTKLQALLASGNDQRQELALTELLSLERADLSAVMRKQLQSGDPPRVNLVLRRLIRTPDPSFEADLAGIAQSRNSRLQLAAMRALAALATPSAKATVQRLANSLPDELAQRFFAQSPENVEQARARRISAVARAEQAQPSTLLALARDPAKAAQDALLRYLEGHELDTATWANVIEYAPTSTVQRIVARSTSAAQSAKLGLLQGLGRRADPKFADTLRADLRSGDQPTRNEALVALARLGDDSVRPELQRLATSPDTADRNLALQLLSARPDTDSFRELERLASDPDAQVMSGALHALQTRSPELVSRLAQRALRESVPEARADLLSLLSDLKPSLSRPLLELALDDSLDSVASQAIQSLGSLQGPASAQRLLSVVNDSNRSAQLRAEAAAGLRTLGGSLAQANRALLDSLSEPEAAGEFVCNPN